MRAYSTTGVLFEDFLPLNFISLNNYTVCFNLTLVFFQTNSKNVGHQNFMVIVGNVVRVVGATSIEGCLVLTDQLEITDVRIID